MGLGVGKHRQHLTIRCAKDADGEHLRVETPCTYISIRASTRAFSFLW